ncbi:restriction endonuclease subunit S [Paenibacillus gansuensis]|uniref:Restriction endonuclease subunit S n=1 Tax=Paenibacillus gansuensis TaxID=306542 RepID=A0ABW5PBP7_9BACL
MDRNQSFLQMLEAVSSIQYNISLILEAKAREAEKTKKWICNHLLSTSYTEHTEQLSAPLKFHAKMTESIDGLAKLENSLARNLKVVLNKNQGSSDFGDFGGGGSGLEGLFDSGNES